MATIAQIEELLNRREEKSNQAFKHMLEENNRTMLTQLSEDTDRKLNALREEMRQELRQELGKLQSTTAPDADGGPRSKRSRSAEPRQAENPASNDHRQDERRQDEQAIMRVGGFHRKLTTAFLDKAAKEIVAKYVESADRDAVKLSIRGMRNGFRLIFPSNDLANKFSRRLGK